MKQTFKHQRPALWWALVIFILCTASFGEAEKSHHFFPGFDKLVHCGLFFVFAVLCSAGLIKKYDASFFTLATGIKIFAAAVLYGGTIELLQKYVFTWRDGDWADLFADSVGAGMAVFGTLVILYATANSKN